MAKIKVPDWLKGVAINLFSTIIGIAVGALVTYFEKVGAGWVKPIMFGLLAWLMTFALIVLFRLASRLPPKQEGVTDDNIEQLVRNWFDRYGLSVQRKSYAADHFNFLVTTTGDKKITVKRRQGFQEYLTFEALIVLTEAQKAFVALLSDQDRLRAMIAIRLEVAHAVIGFTQTDNWEKITLFKELPISTGLTESQFISALWHVEACINSVMATNMLTEIELRERRGLPPPTN